MRKKIKVAVICGGPSNERAVSLKTGDQVLKALSTKKYETYLLEVTKQGGWLLKGGPTKNQRLQKTTPTLAVEKYRPSKDILKTADVAFIGMHGKFGEDGKIQTLLELAGIPYTGSGILASALGMDKMKTLEIVGRYGVRTPKFLATSSIVPNTSVVGLYKAVADRVGYPCVVKPNASGSSIGISIVKNKKQLLPAIKRSSKEDEKILIEEYIKGTELTCGVMGNSGQTELEALPPVEIIPEGEFFDYNSKYFSEKTKEICPARISAKTTARIQELSRKTHFVLGCDGLTRSDFILSPSGQLYFLEINTIPGLTEVSLCPKEARVAGMSFPEFLDKQIELALLKRKTRRT